MESLLIYSTVPHALAILPILYHSRTKEPLYSVYCILILLSTCFSATWHAHGEPLTILWEGNYLLALFLGILEFELGLRQSVVDQVLLLNGLLTTLTIAIDLTSADRSNYVKLHSLWHLVSSAKSFYLSNLLSDRTLYKIEVMGS